MPNKPTIDNPLELSDHNVICSVPEGADALLIAKVWQQTQAQNSLQDIIFVARDDARLSAIANSLKFYLLNVNPLTIPAWDCLPYDRVSPAQNLVGERLKAFAILTNRNKQVAANKPAQSRLILTSINAVMMRTAPQAYFNRAFLTLKLSNRVNLSDFATYFVRNGFHKVATVHEKGEFAIRGSIVDIFSGNMTLPARLDFFGDTLDSIKSFDPLTQRSQAKLKGITILPAGEMMLNDKTISTFRSKYVAEFGAVKSEDALYEAISAGRSAVGMEHWMPYFHDELDTIFDFCQNPLIMTDHQMQESVNARDEQINDYYKARIEAVEHQGLGAPLYKPVKPDDLYIGKAALADILAKKQTIELNSFTIPAALDGSNVIDFGGKIGRKFSAERLERDKNIYDIVSQYLTGLQNDQQKVLICCQSTGSAERLRDLLLDHGIQNSTYIENFQQFSALGAGSLAFAPTPIASGFSIANLHFIAEQDILGDSLKNAHKKRRAADFISEASSLTINDFIVHIEHGIGQFTGLKTIEVSGNPHDCLELKYAGGDRLYLPVENIELLSRYGSEEIGAQLDRLGGSGWQARKAKLKERIKDIANKLIKVAAERMLKKGKIIADPDHLYQEFVARFGFNETEDQLHAIEDIVADMQSGKPMDRLICGDVGFGKTEVALRAAFLAVMSGMQVALVVPTTLLARQHYKTFIERFKDLPIRIDQASRLVGTKALNDTKAAMASGEVDIVIGTHALLAKNIKFDSLGLLIIDEEQHFGVVHKERLKELQSDIHVLTLTATPIPRTMQLAMTGVRELSIIATPPVDRLAIRTFISPLDPVIIREALMREHYRGGQSFYVCPRVSDLEERADFLREFVPEIKFVIAHGQMTPASLDEVMNAFYDGKYDLLLATTIIESGIDIPTANTLIIHRSDMFGLAQLYQLRGRVGRSKTRAYALFTLPTHGKISENAQKRLNVLQSLDSLGAGFTLASHDLDIRGAGNLLGDEQSGHVKEVGFELYQDMLEEAIASLKSGDLNVEVDEKWTSEINIGIPVLIPENYVTDLDLRLGLYRRLSGFETAAMIDDFSVELTDRFGKKPEEVIYLLKIMKIKLMCRRANIDKVDAGPKGLTIRFRKNNFANASGLMELIQTSRGKIKLRNDQRIFLAEGMPHEKDRLRVCTEFIEILNGLIDELDEENV
ncbi:MAG: transcription-repair coupling factor [OCS116 cluster bacterium]|nr:transcription-repair coupling factor [OCS116 cluster bacterium]